MTDKMQCTCNHPYQDQLYGHKIRMGNEMANGQLRCTVCSKEGSPLKPNAPKVVEVAKVMAAPTPKKEEEKAKPKIDRSRKMGKK